MDIHPQQDLHSLGVPGGFGFVLFQIKKGHARARLWKGPEGAVLTRCPNTKPQRQCGFEIGSRHRRGGMCKYQHPNLARHRHRVRIQEFTFMLHRYSDHYNDEPTCLRIPIKDQVTTPQLLCKCWSRKLTCLASQVFHLDTGQFLRTIVTSVDTCNSASISVK